jgi:hypothetical protein
MKCTISAEKQRDGHCLINKNTFEEKWMIYYKPN